MAIVIIAIIYVGYKLIKDAFIKPMAPGSDIKRANIDLYTGKCSVKEMNKRLSNGYYVPKKDK